MPDLREIIHETVSGEGSRKMLAEIRRLANPKTVPEFGKNGENALHAVLRSDKIVPALSIVRSLSDLQSQVLDIVLDAAGPTPSHVFELCAKHDVYGCAPVHYAASYDGVLKRLFERLPESDRQELANWPHIKQGTFNFYPEWMRPIHFAVLADNSKDAAAIVEAGGNPFETNKDGKTAYDLAKGRPRTMAALTKPEILEYLCKKGHANEFEDVFMGIRGNNKRLIDHIADSFSPFAEMDYPTYVRYSGKSPWLYRAEELGSVFESVRDALDRFVPDDGLSSSLWTERFDSVLRKLLFMMDVDGALVFLEAGANPLANEDRETSAWKIIASNPERFFDNPKRRNASNRFWEIACGRADPEAQRLMQETLSAKQSEFREVGELLGVESSWESGL